MSGGHEPLAGDVLAPAAISDDRRRSAVIAALGAGYLMHLLVALLASYPLVAQVSASGIVDFEPGDGKLFEPGGLFLLEVLLHERAGLGALVAPTAVLLAAGALASVVPEWMLLNALAAASRKATHAAATRSGPLHAMPRLGALALGLWVARGLLAALTAALATTAHSSLAGARDERLALLASAGAVLVGLAGWACLSVLHDLAAIEVTRAGASALGAVERALWVARRQARGLGARYAAWTLASGGVLVAGVAAASAFDVSTGGSFAPTAALILHQVTVLARLGLHAAWLAGAIGLAARVPDRRTLDGAQADAFL
jgi:hypothetical protein